jgi:hypothetical protein
MEIWVRSQDKEQLVKTNDFRYKREEKKKTKPFGDFEEARLFCDYDIVEKHYIYSDRFDILGEYPTKERCLEIIDEIQKLLCQTLMVVRNLENKPTLEIENIDTSVVVYEMPRE